MTIVQFSAGQYSAQPSNHSNKYNALLHSTWLNIPKCISLLSQCSSFSNTVFHIPTSKEEEKRKRKKILVMPSAAQIWISLPLSLHYSHSLSVSRTGNKTHLCRQHLFRILFVCFFCVFLCSMCVMCVHAYVSLGFGWTSIVIIVLQCYWSLYLYKYNVFHMLIDPFHLSRFRTATTNQSRLQNSTTPSERM